MRRPSKNPRGIALLSARYLCPILVVYKGGEGMSISAMLGVFASFFQNVPAAVWSGLTGAFSALLGVLIANKGQEKRQAQQLRHDSEEKEKDRLIAMRREVYLKLPPAMVKVEGFLAELPTIDLLELSTSAHVGYGEIAAQVQIICGLDTAEEVERLGVMYGQHLIRAIQELDELQNVRIAIKLRNESFEEAHEELDRILDAMKQMKESSLPLDSVLWSKLGESADRLLTESTQLRKTLNELRAKKQRLIAEYHRSEAAKSTGLQQQRIKVVASLRKEIGLAHDLADYQSRIEPLSNELTKSALQAMDGWASDLENREPS
jgi:hypothetical protein